MGIKGIIEKVIGTYSDRELKKIYPIVDKVLLWKKRAILNLKL